MTDFGDTMMCEQSRPDRLVRDVQNAERAGFDFSVISDHYAPWLEEQGHSGYAWSILGGLFEGGDQSHRGRHFQVESARLWDLPDTRVPIGIAVSGAESCALAGRKADIMIATEPEAGPMSRSTSRRSGRSSTRGSRRSRSCRSARSTRTRSSAGPSCSPRCARCERLRLTSRTRRD